MTDRPGPPPPESAPLSPRLWTLRQLLFGTALGLLLVAALLMISAVWIFSRAQATVVQRGVVNTGRAVAAAVDKEIERSLTALRVLGNASSLERGDLPTFYQRMQAIHREFPEWAAVILADPTGQELVNDQLPLGASLPGLPDRALPQELQERYQPLVSNLPTDRTTSVADVILLVPVVQDGRVRYTLGAAYRPAGLGRILRTLDLPATWSIAVYDRNRAVLAFREEAPRFPEEAARAALQFAAAEGFFPWLSWRDGRPGYVGYARGPVSRWIVALWLPAAELDAPFRRAWRITLTAGLALGALSLGGAWALSRRFRQPLSQLARAAGPLSRGESVAVTPSTIREVRELELALRAAGTGRREAEHETASLFDRALKARQEAEAASRAKDDFLAMLGHELRTPLNAMLGWVSLLQAGNLTAETSEKALGAIQRSIQAQAQLINDMLDISRIATGQMRLSVKPVDLGTLLQAAVETIRPTAEAKQVRLQAILDSGALLVAGDPDRLQQVVWNLLSNAVKFTPKGGRVQVELQRSNAQATIVVTDNGQGIRPDLLPHIFDWFRQGESGSTRAHSGLGLGLALVRHLVELHGGSVVAESAGEGRGATFTVTLPLALARTTRDDGRAESAPVTPVTLPGLRVLVVDDDRDTLELLDAVLGQAGAAVRLCTSSAEALQAYAAERPDLVISDLEMPGEDGLTFMQKLRAREAGGGRQLPSIALTGYGRTEDRMRALGAGYNLHMPKPVVPAELLMVVASLAGR